ncbi:peroxiredoxin [Sinimarinibacterium sp. CAU 1509]|uniref:peroxidase family protein n=1 Tax=Sinimarinibacterium sp. CAU 1509 TaxID=2562283 RepID=UPI0010AD6906|nr:peroxidase family protein [Sinimarinibacterium sp. CAU 1509]TJY61043.1 peroxiredoxin [Sinimarinibacterium sp. CAU 1509]
MAIQKHSVAVAIIALILAGCDSGSSSSEREAALDVRAIDGAGNNPNDPTMGEAGHPLLREADAAFADGFSAPAGPERPNPRAVSSGVCRQDVSRPNRRGASDFLWQWGQFLDHDLSRSPEASPKEPLGIPVPPGDPQFDPGVTGAVVIDFNRSSFDPLSGINGPREQMNTLTAYIDASNVYGSDPVRADALRTHDGTGRLRISPQGFLPFNDAGFDNAPSPNDSSLFLAGDVRANEQLGLTAMHTLFVREHNLVADRIHQRDPALSDERIYQRARAIVGAEVQAITYNEFLPILLGPGVLAPYAGYDADVNARMMNEFTSVAFRVGHSMVSPVLRRLESEGASVAAGDLPLRDAYFQPQRLLTDGGIDPILRGLASQTAQEIDPFIVDDLRNFLFGSPGSGGLDLAALNIQRGRDHGMPSYNGMRLAFGLPAKTRFDEISSDPEIVQRLQQTYGSVDLIDPWIGGLSEDHVPGALVGELFIRIIADQFERLRDGDRYWYQNPDIQMLTPEDRSRVESTTLARVIRDNTAIGNEISDAVFLVAR